MKTFIGMMLVVILSTCLIWHNYQNTDKKIYAAKRKLFLSAVSLEFAIIFIVLLIAYFVLNGAGI